MLTPIRSGVRRLFRIALGGARDARRDADDELAAHLEERAQLLTARGMPIDDARAEAVRRLGQPVEQVRAILRADAIRRTRRERLSALTELTTHSAFHDVRAAARSLRRAPAWSCAVAGILAVSLGAASTVYSIADAVLFKALPYRQPEQLVWVSSVKAQRPDAPFSLPEFLDFRARATTVDLAAYGNWSASYFTPGGTRRLQGARFSANTFDVLGAHPSAGRLLRSDDDSAGAPAVVVLGYRLWRQEFGGDSTVVGRELRLNGQAYTVVGVLPRHLPLPLRDIEVASALRPDLDPRRTVRTSVNFLRLTGRLQRSRTGGEAERELSAIAADLKRQYPDAYDNRLGVHLTQLQQYLVGGSRDTLVVILAAVGLIVAIALLNVLNLLLIRGLTRQSELVVRRALGGSRWHLTALLAGEGTLLAAVGGIAGTLIACGLVRVVSTLAAARVPRAEEATVDLRTIAFVLGMSIVAAAAFSVLPVVAALRAAPELTLRGGGRTGSSRRQARIRDMLVVAQIGFAVIVGAATAALANSLIHLARVPLGFRPDSVFIARVSLPSAYRSPVDVARFTRELETRLSAASEVVSVGATSMAPLSGLLWAANFEVVGGARVVSPRDRQVANLRAVTPGYLTSIGASLHTGRGFTSADDERAPRVTIVSRALAERYMNGRNPIGQTVLIDDNDVGPRPLLVVGVVENMRHVDLEGPPSQDVFIPMSQVHRDGVPLVTANQFWAVRVRTDPGRLAPAFARALRDVDRAAALSQPTTLRAFVDDALAARRFSVGVLIAFAIIAIVLSALGCFALLAYAVEQRRREISLRMAFGASPSTVWRFVVRRAVWLTCAGAAVGVVGAIVMGGLLSRLMFGVSPTAPLSLAAVTSLVAAASLIAAMVPARRAAHTDPMLVLR